MPDLDGGARSETFTELPQELSGPGVRIAIRAWRFRRVARRSEKSDREVPFHVLLRRPKPPSIAHSSTADRRQTAATRTALLGDTPRLSNACPNGISNFAGRVRC